MSDVLAVVEHRRGELRDVSLELIEAGADLAAELDGELHVAVIGGNVEAIADRLNRDGVDVIHTIADGAEFNHDVYVQAVRALYETLEPAVVLAPHTVNALDYVPAVAVDLDLPLVTDVIDVEVTEAGLRTTRGLYESKIEATVTVTERPCVVTLRPGEWARAGGVSSVPVEAFEFEIEESAVDSHVEGFEEAGAGDVDVTAADFLIGVGRGIGEEANLSVIEDLAEVTDATIAASRPLVDNGWFDTSRQVGQSGKTVSPDVYLAVGISGAVQHVAGIKGANTIIAVNTDPHAPIFDIADQAIVGDLFEVIPELTDQLR
ncbi:electron transfer flavoprotein alpha subunit [Halodesulfurarchaeum formicicum]|uniref:Electron transfer flavoprotein alpha subunit n=1 Tax=Halodesulfurarchaeum formicicum TaxID=1873524 RepID=A0A1D8S6J5_9EURY|nr:electron transfer flavoprotein subunit alpha/FixB family protein [Halodesulfurarchaeum formicicum]AOW80982.1 electron transfer flavoprotein alpha subunit [Halodesulfurarchaeum formicicum]APE96318.1 electron transfer flavoprotein alpha subunit [Halodesulfurarchaeum formicicum]